MNSIFIAGGILVLCVICLSSCMKRQIPDQAGTENNFQVGGYYSISEDGKVFQVIKVLSTDQFGVHIRLYKNKMSGRPTESELDVNTLDLGSVKDPDGFGMGHLPISYKSFNGWHAEFIKSGSVTDDELDGYKEWKNAGGGYF